MAGDVVSLMRRLGHERLAAVGTTAAATSRRGSRSTIQAVTALAVLDSVPITEALADATFAQEWWHWCFFAQPDKPE